MARVFFFVASMTPLEKVTDKQRKEACRVAYHCKAGQGKAVVSYGKADYTSVKEGIPSWWRHANIAKSKGRYVEARQGMTSGILGIRFCCICVMKRLCRVGWCM